MPEVVEQARLALSAIAIWRQIGDFGAVGDWHPWLAEVASNGNAPGALRHVEAEDGGRQVERLEAYDSERRVYRYSMQETQLPVGDCSAELRVDDDVAGGSLVTWRALPGDSGQRTQESRDGSSVPEGRDRRTRRALRVVTCPSGSVSASPCWGCTR
jgi:mxaD protein